MGETTAETSLRTAERAVLLSAKEAMRLFDAKDINRDNLVGVRLGLINMLKCIPINILHAELIEVLDNLDARLGFENRVLTEHLLEEQARVEGEQT